MAITCQNEPVASTGTCSSSSASISSRAGTSADASTAIRLGPSAPAAAGARRSDARAADPRAWGVTNASMVDSPGVGA